MEFQLTHRTIGGKIPLVRPNSTVTKSRGGCDATAGDFATSMENKSLPPSSRSWAAAQMESLECRQMLNAATLKHGLLTVYGTEGTDHIFIFYFTARRGPALIGVQVDNSLFEFPRFSITRMRVFGLAGNDQITLDDLYAPSLSDILIDAGDGNDFVTDATPQHQYNRRQRISILGGAGNDTIAGGDHTFALSGGDGSDELYGGAAGAVLAGGNGDDIVSANLPALDTVLIGTASDPSLSLIGGAGDDVLIGNNFHDVGVTDTLTGGSGNDSFFAFDTDAITDSGDGTDQRLGDNQFTGPVAVNQTASLEPSFIGSGVIVPRLHLGDNGPSNRIYVSDNAGTLTMQGPSGSTFTLGDLLNAGGYPVDRLGIPAGVALSVNGTQTLTGDQIATYQIADGDLLTLTLA